MSRSTWKRALAALLVVAAFTVAVPARASVAASNMDTFLCPANRVWTKVLDWVGRFWSSHPTSAPDDAKFGAGQSSDGRSKTQAYF